MWSWIRQLDELLRGRHTGPQQLSGGDISISLRVFTGLSVILGCIYGFFMGWYAISARPFSQALLQVLASIIKLPALFLLTLVVTFPSLYVFNALIGCRLTFQSTLRLLVAAIAMHLAVAASLGPILGFFTVSTTSYGFIVLLNVLLLAIGGLIGLAFLLQTLRRMAARDQIMWARPTASTTGALPSQPSEAPAPPASTPPGPLEPPVSDYPDSIIGSSRSIFRVWVIIYALVGAQMGWILRPFIGSPDMAFEFFRSRQGNFFQAVLSQLSHLLSFSTPMR